MKGPYEDTALKWLKKRFDVVRTIPWEGYESPPDFCAGKWDSSNKEYVRTGIEIKTYRGKLSINAFLNQYIKKQNKQAVPIIRKGWFVWLRHNKKTYLCQGDKKKGFIIRHTKTAKETVDCIEQYMFY